MPNKFLTWLKNPLLRLRKKKSPINADIADSAAFYISPVVSNIKNRVETFKYFIFLITLILAVLLFLNLTLDNNLQDLKERQITLSKELRALSEVELKYTQIGTKIAYYQELEDSRNLIWPKAQKLFENVTSEITLVKISITDTHYLIISRAASPLSFTKLIMSHFSSDLVSQITLKSADLDVETGMFLVEMEGKFK